MDRRAFLKGAGLGGFAALLAMNAPLLAADGADAGGTEFSWDILKARVKALAAAPFQPPPKVSPGLAALDYDQYRNINFDPDKAIWHDTQIRFRMELFHDGYIYNEPIDIYLVDKGKASKIRYDRSLFLFGAAERGADLPPDAGFSGFRLRAPADEPGVFEEFAVFQGASYFRGRAKGQNYGLSARGLAIDTAQPSGEEFPVFRSYWVDSPAPKDTHVTVYALLDSKSISGAYRFVVSRIVDTVMEIECQLYPRRSLTHAGIAPFSSMYFFSPADPTFHDDFRPRVHDSDGLILWTGMGEWIWRPLVNSPYILFSMFSDRSPRGFGLMQRQRDFVFYQDINAAYEKRPSAWVEPLSDWGEGSVDLIELPTGTEYADNVVAFWRPREPMQPGQAYDFRYRLSWCWHLPVKRDVAQVVATRAGKGLTAGSRYFVVDFAGGALYADADDEDWDFEVGASAGFISAYTIAPNPFIDGKRIAIEYHPDGSKVADLNFQIRRAGKPLTEKWVYRWAP